MPIGRGMSTLVTIAADVGEGFADEASQFQENESFDKTVTREAKVTFAG